MNGPAHLQRGASGLALACALPPALVLALAGVAKVADAFYPAVFLNSTLHLPMDHAVLLARALGITELTIGVCLVALAGRTVLPALAAAGLFAFFSALLLRLLLANPGGWRCGCFGDLFAEAGHISLPNQCALDLALLGLLVVHISLHRGARRLMCKGFDSQSVSESAPDPTRQR
jgi:hypothetical protein